MDEFRVALMITRIIAALLIALGGSWLISWGLIVANDWVFSPSHGQPPLRNWAFYAAFYAGVYAAAGVIMGRFDHQIAKFATRP